MDNLPLALTIMIPFWIHATFLYLINCLGTVGFLTLLALGLRSVVKKRDTSKYSRWFLALSLTFFLIAAAITSSAYTASMQNIARGDSDITYEALLLGWTSARFTYSCVLALIVVITSGGFKYLQKKDL